MSGPTLEVAVPIVPPQLTSALAPRYAVLREIGAGGMATVYLAKDLKHGRDVAIKVLRPELAEVVGSDRFLREIEIAASLTHPRILPLHDSGEADGILYYVMPHIDGPSLGERLSAGGALPVPEAIRYLRQIVDALGAAHDRGIVHRDVKPANVLLTGGHALVADFGIARAVSRVTTESPLTAIGVAMGTPQYMAPEQATADEGTDHRADLFAAGAVAYEMLTGEAPFEAETTRGVFTALMTRNPSPPHLVRESVPRELSDLVMWCLEKEPGDRPQSAAQILGRLDAFSTAEFDPDVSRGAGARVRRRRAVAAATAVVLTAAALGAWQWNRGRAEREWASSVAVPDAIRLVEAHRLGEAARLAEEARAILGDIPAFERYWPLVVSPFRVETQPTGAAIQYRVYGDGGSWESLGLSPYSSERFPVGAYEFRIELDGYEPVELARSLVSSTMVQEIANIGIDYLDDPSYVIDLELSPLGSLPDGMLPVEGGLYSAIPVAGFEPVSPHPVPDFLVDRAEVSNADFREFIEADGYAESSYWSIPFVRDGRPVSRDVALSEFVDETGRPGPAGWTLGQQPQGTDDLPVGGVSWYEAAAYCAWLDKSLPTLYHWARATLPSTDGWQPFGTILATTSNFADEGPRPVGNARAMGISGALDLTGNVREWVSTSAGEELRYILGGAWSDQTYWINNPYVESPWDRQPTNGFRCVRFEGGQAPDHLSAPLEFPDQDLTRRPTLSDAVYEAQAAFYRYDTSAPLNANVDSTGTTGWGARWEWVTIDGAYGERLPIRLHIPQDTDPPYEALIFFGGGNTIRATDIGEPMRPLDQLVRSGRVLVEPIYDGTYSRNDGRTVARLSSEGSTQLIANWVRDVGRALDYLASRPDMRGDRVAFVGQSLGTHLFPYLGAFEPRIRAGVIYNGGLGKQTLQSTIDRIAAMNSRVTVPVLMLGGGADTYLTGAHQRAWFESLATPEENKRFQLFDSGHWPLPMGDLLRETVDFLDQHLIDGEEADR